MPIIPIRKNMFGFNIISKPRDLKSDRAVIKKIFECAGKTVNKAQNGTINIIFETDEVMRELNRGYRSIDKTTDVLSFHYFDDYSEVSKGMIAGEVILSIEKIGSQALEFGISKEEEFYKLLIHSVLHLLGYDHEDDDDYVEMSRFEKTIESEINSIFNLKIN